MTESSSSLTLHELLAQASSRRFTEAVTPGDRGLADDIRFPFAALVGQPDLKLALMLGLINPAIGGVLLVGLRGTGKTTAVRGLMDLMPTVERSLCSYGCLPADVETGGLDAVCPDCARKYGQGEPLTFNDSAKLVELPLNARLDDVVGGLDERAAVHNRMQVKRGLLAQADQNLLYIDEVNLLGDDIVDAILDAAAQGVYVVRRGPLSATYRARFVLIGSMNPEEGKLRPQILDRFGLRVIVYGLGNGQDRLEAYHRARAYLTNPLAFVAGYAAETLAMRAEIDAARRRLPSVSLSDSALRAGLALTQAVGVDSLRAEITLFEAARAHAAADARDLATLDDIRAVAAATLRLRRSEFIEHFLAAQRQADQELHATIQRILTHG
jgi:magnesium chelatase subunit I